MDEVCGKSGHGGHDTPDREGPDNNVPAHALVCPARDRDAAYHVKEGERETCQQAKLGVRETEFSLYRFLKNNEQLTVYEIESVDDREDQQNIDAIFLARVGRAFRRFRSRWSRMDGVRLCCCLFLHISLPRVLVLFS